MSINDRKTISDDELIKIYIEQLNEKEQLAYKIAQRQLETSFCMERSIGFLSFKTDYNVVSKPQEQEPKPQEQELETPKKKIVKKKVVRKLKKVKLVKKKE